jgi:hypothetical protein
MERPRKVSDHFEYSRELEKYCDFLESSLKHQVERTDYWCTKATEARALCSEQVKEIARLRRERG